MSIPDQPRHDDAGYQIWRRLADGDPVAPADLAAAYLGPLIAWLQAHNPRVPEENSVTAAGSAIVDLIKRPTIYQPERQSLEVFLRIAASGDLKNLLRAERRHATRRADWEEIELSPKLGKYLQDWSSDPAQLIEDAEARAERQAAEESMLEGLTPAERQVWALMREGERRTPPFAAVLELLDRPAAEQARAVKQVKDRLKKRLERFRGNHG